MFKPRFNTIEEENPIKDEDYFWRYVDLHKFFSFVNNKSLSFTRLDQFDDPLEAANITELAEFYYPWLCVKEIKDDKFNKSLSIDFIEEQKKRRDHPFEFFPLKLLKRQRECFASCWYLNERESLAMWDLYSNPDSVAIKFSTTSLIESLKTNSLIQDNTLNDGVILGGRVLYEDYTNYDFYLSQKDFVEPFLVYRKHDTFKHESEYRFTLFIPPPTDLLRVEIYFEEFSKLDFKIITHPRMSSWKRMNIEQYCTNQKIEFERSLLLSKTLR